MSSSASELLSAELAEARRLLSVDPSRAEAAARDILREQPEEPEARLILASALRRKGALISAASILETLAQTQSHLPPVHYELGLVLSALGDNKGATTSLRYAVDLDPNFAAAWHALGDQYTRMRSKVGANKAYSEYFNVAVGDDRLRDAMAAIHDNRLDEAEGILKAFLEEKPDNVTAIKMLAEIAQKTHRMLQAEALFKRCIDLAPDFAAARQRYAILLLTQNKPAEAIDQVDELLKLEPDDPYHRNLKAAAYIRMSAFEDAAAEYEIMLKASPNQPGAWMAYGHALKAMGRREQCIAAYRRTISLLPGLGDAYWSLANLKTYRFTEAEVAAMREQLMRADLKGENKGFFHFALAKALEDEGRFEEAFDHYRRGNDFIRTKVTYDPEEMSAQVRRAKALFTRPFFAQRKGQGAAAPDPIFIVGLPRSGSTLIEQILASHSAIEGTTELRAIPYLAGRLGGKKKPEDPLIHYPEILGTLDAANLQGLGEEYLWRARQHRILGRPFFIDKMPNNFAHVGLIHLILPNAKIIDVRRHPLACCLSNFKQHFGNGQQFSYSLPDIGRYYFDYVELMAHYDDVLPGRVHRVIYEQLVEQPEQEVRRVLEYLGLPFEDACLRFHENDRVVRSASAEQVRQPLNSDGFDQWRNFEPWLGSLKSALGFVLDAYPDVPKFYGRVTTAPGFSQTIGEGDQKWSVKAVAARTGARPAVTP